MPVFINDLTVFSPAKVNLNLAIMDKRQDGYHDLESVFLIVDFGDTLRFSLRKNGEFHNITEIVMKGLDSAISTENNIVFKAVSVFREKTGFFEKLEIIIDKKIPLGSGLGGGSSDAASTLLAMNKIAGFPCNRQDLIDMALTLGSDVPFFIHETSAAYITGRGERITPFKAPLLHLALVNPGFPSDTAAAFRLLDEYREENKEFKVRNAQSAIKSCFNENSSFFNDFLDIFPNKEKAIYNEIISQLKNAGADFANLSGTGSTCFGVFKDLELTKRAVELLDNKWNFVKLAKTYFVSK